MTDLVRHIRSVAHQQDANAMIEVSLFLPVMILLLLAVLDVGLILSLDLRVVDSARSAAESATLRSNATRTDIAQVVGSDSANGITTYQISAVNYCTCANGTGLADCSSHSSCGSYGIPNQYIRVTASATLPLLFTIPGFPVSYTVRSVAIARTAWTGTN